MTTLADLRKWGGGGGGGGVTLLLCFFKVKENSRANTGFH